jgi:hypothetical protein
VEEEDFHVVARRLPQFPEFVSENPGILPQVPVDRFSVDDSEE